MGKKKNKMKEKNKGYTVLVIVLCVCIAALIIALIAKNNSDSNTSSSDDETVTQTQANEQVYNSVNDIVMDKDTKEAALNISNAADNTYSLKVTVELDGGDVLYASDLIAPGETVGTVTFDTDLSVGEYSVVISVDSYSSDGSEMASGVIYTRTLIVE